ncbi:MAG: SEC-C metal-binding domain-containing protein [Caryophanon sp.]|nr:SEC-C metal-binding domain-containing protein [Caryophanon sp.]
MIGRNDPCLCGSGKKYKKCCAKSSNVSAEQLSKKELKQVIDMMFATYPQEHDHRALIEHFQEWVPELRESLEPDFINAVSIDDFFFHQRVDIWQGHLDQMTKLISRQATRNVLQAWRNPHMFVGRVTSVSDDFIEAAHLLTGESVCIRRENNKPIPVGMFVFAFLIADRTLQPAHYMATSTLIFITEQYADVFAAYAREFASDDAASVFKEHHLTFWMRLVEAGYHGEEFTEKEEAVVKALENFLQKHDLQTDQLVDVVENFLVETQPKARKMAAISAGAVRFAQEHGFFGKRVFTIKELTESFDISSSSLTKYAQELAAYYKAQ